MFYIVIAKVTFCMLPFFTHNKQTFQRYYNSDRASSPEPMDKVGQVEGQVDELKGIMVKNIGELTDINTCIAHSFTSSLKVSNRH